MPSAGVAARRRPGAARRGEVEVEERAEACPPRLAWRRRAHQVLDHEDASRAERTRGDDGEATIGAVVEVVGELGDEDDVEALRLELRGEHVAGAMAKPLA
jgi:hypothetical protein